MSQALYRKYRSTSLDEIVGQDHVTTVLKNALAGGRISHAYLLTGPRGVGKTSIARILAHEINALPYSRETNLDIIEIDAASNNGVDDVRDLREKVTIVPVSAKKKIYIIDEVHMLSKPAFNALLKTLEEPPEHVVFILATTEVHKLPDTILSRTQRFHFRPIELNDLKKHLSSIARKEKIKIDEAALEQIAERARGSFRDGISLLDQLSNLGDGTITAEMVEKTLGLAPTETVEKMAQAIIHYRLAEAIELMETLKDSGISPIIFSEQLSRHLKPYILPHPHLIELIETLIEVGRSYDPELKLLATIASAASAGEEKPVKSVALHATTPAITTVAPQQKTASLAKKPAREKKPLSSVDWSEVLEYVRTHHQPLYSFLHKAEAYYDNGLLTLHFSYALHHKKLEDGSKYRHLLSESLIALYGDMPDITITSGKQPPQNATAAAVAAIMGGGEEVKVTV